MCYYATTDYVCGDWKWGNMMLQCPRQHRIGETCGAKLVHHESVTKSATVCKTCEEINTKKRRLSKTYANIKRWAQEPDKFSASLEKAVREARELEHKIRDLESRRSCNATKLGDPARPTPTTANMLPPLTSMNSSYEYQPTSGSLNRRQDSSGYTVPRNNLVQTSAGSGGGTMTATPYSPAPAPSYANLPLRMSNPAPPSMTTNRQNVAYTARR